MSAILETSGGSAVIIHIIDGVIAPKFYFSSVSV